MEANKILHLNRLAKKKTKDISTKIINLLHDKIEQSNNKIVTYNTICYLLFNDKQKQNDRFDKRKWIDFKVSQLCLCEKILDVRILNIMI